MKRPQAKFHGDTMSHSEVIRSKVKIYEVNFHAGFFLVIDILLKLQKQIFCFCKFSCNSEVLTGLLRL